MLLKNWQREIASVAIAVVEGEGGEARAPLHEPPPRLGERDEVEAEAGDERKRGVEKGRRDFQQPVGRIARGGRRERPHAVKGENDARTARQRRQDAVQAAGAKGGEAGLDQGMLKRHAHRRSAGRRPRLLPSSRTLPCAYQLGPP